MDKHKAASKDELLEMIRFGADTVRELNPVELLAMCSHSRAQVIKMGDVEDPDFDIEEVQFVPLPLHQMMNS